MVIGFVCAFGHVALKRFYHALVEERGFVASLVGRVGRSWVVTPFQARPASALFDGLRCPGAAEFLGVLMVGGSGKFLPIVCIVLGAL